MTRKHFIAIAEAISKSTISQADKGTIARDLCYPLRKANAGFNAPRFVAACLVVAKDSK